MPPEHPAKRPDDGRPWQVAVWVPQADLLRLAAALGPAAVVIPCDSFDAFSSAVRRGVAAAVVGSASLARPDVTPLAALVVGAPTTVFAGLHAVPAASAGPAAEAAFNAERRLTRAGVHAIYLPVASGLHGLVRSLATARLADPVQRACVAAVLADVWGPYRTDTWEARRTALGGPAEAGLLQLFATAFGPEGGAVSDLVAEVAARLGTDAAAFQSWFVRAGLPSAERYVAAARLVRAAWAGEPPAPDAVPEVVRPADPRAPVPVRRACRRLQRLVVPGAGAPPNASSAPLAGAAALRCYRKSLLVPFRDTLSRFDPAHGMAQ